MESLTIPGDAKIERISGGWRLLSLTEDGDITWQRVGDQILVTVQKSGYQNHLIIRPSARRVRFDFLIDQARCSGEAAYQDVEKLMIRQLKRLHPIQLPWAEQLLPKLRENKEVKTTLKSWLKDSKVRAAKPKDPYGKYCAWACKCCSVSHGVLFWCCVSCVTCDALNS